MEKYTLLGLHHGPTPKLTSAGPVPEFSAHIELYRAISRSMPARSGRRPGAPLPRRPMVAGQKPPKAHPKLADRVRMRGNVCRSACFSLVGNSKERVSNCFVRRPLHSSVYWLMRDERESRKPICTAHRHFLDTMLWDISIDRCSTTGLPSSDKATAEQKQGAQAEAEAVHTISEISFLTLLPLFSLLALQ